MPLSSGARLGPYEILSPLGAGGMGEVYKARDTRLDRSVAVKVLPEALARDPHFRERFDREARAISQLEHPHICPLYDVGAHEGTSYLVMQLLDGETLAARIQRGALPIAQALDYAIQIADALTAAHRAGIVHRDLKPGNVMITKSGARLLDFGLATSRPTVLAGASGATMSAKLTAQGTIVGTFEYMAPEQIDGGETDERSDIWAFGCVLYEMLTGERPFSGKTPASVIANILGSEPPRVGERQPVTPAALDHAVHRCLAKDPTERWQSITDVGHELRWVAAGPSSPVTSGRSAWKHPALLAAAAGLVLATALLTWLAAAPSSRTTNSSGAPRKVLVPIPAHLELTGFGSASAPHFALSPDGRRIVYAASTVDRTPSMWVQELDSRIARPIAASDEATSPFWFPDSDTLGFIAGGWLKTISMKDERPANILRVLDTAGATSNGEVILVGRGSSSLLRVPATGGAAEEVYPLEDDEGHRWPQFLPNGRQFLYAKRRGGIMLGSLGEPASTELLSQQAGAAFAPPNYLLFFRPDVRKLRAQALDMTTLRPSGGPVDAVEPATYSSGSNYPTLSASADGVLAYWDGTIIDTEPGWFDRAGKRVPSLVPENAYNLALSPRSDRIVFTRRPRDGGVPVVWQFDVNTGAVQRVSYTPQGAARPMWLTDDEIRFSSIEGSIVTLFSRPASGARQEQEIGRVPIESEIAAVGNFYAADWTTDGLVAIVSVTLPKSGRDIMAYDTRTKALRPIIQTEGLDVQPRLSPDGRWIAYASDETGRFEVYVHPFGEAGAKRQISQAGGSQPVWRRDGKELFFLAADRKLTAVPVTTGTTFEYQSPKELFQTSLRSTYAPYPVNYSVSADGERFLLESVKPHTRPTISLYINWPSALRK